MIRLVSTIPIDRTVGQAAVSRSWTSSNMGIHPGAGWRIMGTGSSPCKCQDQHAVVSRNGRFLRLVSVLISQNSTKILLTYTLDLIDITHHNQIYVYYQSEEYRAH